MSGPLEAIELETGPEPGAAVIWLHGLGADGSDFVPVVDALDLPAMPIRFVFPHAPYQSVTINNGMVMRAWYDIVSTDLDRRADEAGVRASQRLVEQLLEREKRRGIPAHRIALAGFSQGGAIALQTGLRHPERLAGIMALSTWLPLAATLAAERSPINADLPIFMAHGSMDEMIGLDRAELSRKRLEALGYKPEFREYPMGHAVCPAEVGDISDWLARVLAA